MEPWQIELEFEIDKLLEEKAKELKSRQGVCLTCNVPLIDNICPECGKEVGHVTETFHDDGFEDYTKQVEKEWKEFEKETKWEDAPDEE